MNGQGRTLALGGAELQASAPGVAGRRRARLGVVEFAAAAAGFAVLAALLSFAMGRDLNWDFFNYHGYAAFDPFGRRLEQDYFPAGYQGYLDRLCYVPFGWMERAGWHSLAIGSGLAAIASLNVLFLYLIARDLTIDARRPRVVAATLALFGAANGQFLLQLGSTFVDPVTTPPVLAAVWLLTRARGERSTWWAGVLVGASVALKLTNVPFAFGLVVCALVGHDRLAAACRAAVCAAAGVLVGFGTLYGPWGWKLYERFGSPVFPLFNGLFKAPAFPPVSVSFARFVPQTLEQALERPFAMIEPHTWIYGESVAPDIRPALLIALLGFAVLVFAWRRGRGAATGILPVEHRFGGRRLAAFFATSTLLWLVTSGNGRYATPILLLLGPMTFIVAAGLIGAPRAAMLCLVAFVLQCVQIVSAGNPRWMPSDWSTHWLEADVPQALKQAPALYISTSTSSESYVAAYVHPDSVFVNPIGAISLPTGGPGWSDFVALRDRFAGRTFVLFPLVSIGADDNPERRIDTMNDAVDRLGLGIEKQGCQTLRFNVDTQAIPYVWERLSNTKTKVRTVFACPAVRLAESSPRLRAARALATTIFDAYERKCPGVFSPGGMQTEGAGQMWSRLYGKHDLLLSLNLAGGEISYHMERQATEAVIGNLNHWQQDVDAFHCRLPHDGRRDLSILHGDAPR